MLTGWLLDVRKRAAGRTDVAFTERGNLWEDCLWSKVMVMVEQNFLKILYLCIWLCWVLVVARGIFSLPCSMWDL